MRKPGVPVTRRLRRGVRQDVRAETRGAKRVALYSFRSTHQESAPGRALFGLLGASTARKTQVHTSRR